jgi:hypothetical protein
MRSGWAVLSPESRCRQLTESGEIEMVGKRINRCEIAECQIVRSSGNRLQCHD